MKFDALCPISDRRIDENVTRFNATFTVLFLVIFLLTNNLFPIAFLAIDFLTRGAKKPEYSLFARLSNLTVNALSISPKIINAGPKFFAARIGFAFSVGILLASALNATVVVYALTAVFALCAFLEAAFAFCVACQIYPFLYKLVYESKYSKVTE
ncbi:MAG: DUF4395 domain-containing protein [Bacteroidales bacterium]